MINKTIGILMTAILSLTSIIAIGHAYAQAINNTNQNITNQTLPGNMTTSTLTSSGNVTNRSSTIISNTT